MRLVQRTVELHPGESKLVEGNYNGGVLFEVAAFGEGDSSLLLDGRGTEPSRGTLVEAEMSVLWLSKLWPKPHVFATMTDGKPLFFSRHGLRVSLSESAEHPVLVVLFLMFE